MKNEIDEDEIDFGKLFNRFKRYKWLIIILTSLTTLMMAFNLYFTPSVYISTAILEKTKEQKGIQETVLSNSFITRESSSTITKEIELLKTFSINNEAIKKVNFYVRFYIYEGYKRVEVFDDIAISIDKIEILDTEILNKRIILSPTTNGYSLELENSLKDKFFKRGKRLLIDSKKEYKFGELIDLQSLKLRVNQKKFIEEPIIFKIVGDNRMIYDNIISKNLTVVPLQNETPLISISYKDTIPQRADLYLNALSESFIEQNILIKNQQNSKVLTFINEQLDGIRGALKKSENRLEKYQVSNKIIKPSIQAKSFIEELSNIEIKISENRLKKKLVNNLISLVQESRSLDSIAPSLIELKDVASVELVKILQNLQMQEDELKMEYTNKFPKLISVRKKIYYIRQKILNNINNIKRNIIAKSYSLKKEKKNYEKKLDSLPTKEKRVVNIQRDYEVSSKMYNYLLEKRTENQLIQVSTLSDYRIIDKAHSNNLPIEPKRMMLMVVALLIGLFIAILLAIILDIRNKKIIDKKDIETLTEDLIYGIIPKLSKKDIGVEVFKEPHSIFTESYRSIRNHIKIEEVENRANIILISSLISGEGKSTITANLSAIFQLAGYKSIILSLDLRKPTLHNYFNINNSIGMSGYLKGENSIDEIIFKTQYDNLHIISSGPVPINPSELILSNRLTELLNLLKSQYDYIFIDTAPIGLVSDTLNIMKYADLNLLVLKENFTEKSFIEDIETILERNNIKNRAFILNASSSKEVDNNYGYGSTY